jgi:uncharacterized protein YjbJ (UPF0337 family)
MASALKQEAFMNWSQIELSWIQLKGKIVFQWGRLTDGDGKRVDLIGAEASRTDKSGDAQMSAFRPDDHAKRSEFSLHIGC